ncbi:recombinase family protein [Aeromonas hydrophila]|uniref:recombinase family protein n=1 Tax=Aeromonas hydrophila TaxID=644 RepID=UPI00208FD764|nr:recombinase family protein [Aeromonas hydrophila]MCO4201225.1 recombinase family protein [Aeromonas hydrophila]
MRRRIGYSRVSTTDQSLDRQTAAFEALGLDKIYEDKATGANTCRDGFQQLLADLTAGDHLYVYSLDRLARNTRDLVNTIEDLYSRGVSTTIIGGSSPMTFTADAIGKLLLTVVGAVGEFERSLINDRCQAGREIAKANGVYKGRPRNEEQEQRAQTIKKLLMEGYHPKDIATITGAGVSTVFRIKKALSTEQTGL